MITDWLGIEFESSTCKTEQFGKFAKSFRAALVQQLKTKGLVLKRFNVGHFYVSGFIYNSKTMKHAYFSIDDVRQPGDAWYKKVLFRTAQGVDDYRGGSNNYSPFDDLGKNLLKITEYRR